MLRRQKPAPVEPEVRWLEVDASMTGTLAFKEPVNLQINGRFEGALQALGSLVIGEKAIVRAEIQGEDVIVAGRVEGSIHAAARLELRAGARVFGKIVTPRLVVHEGCVIQGTLDMNRPEPGSAGWMDADELARYLEVDASTIDQWAQEGRLPAQREGDAWRFDRVQIEDWLAHEKIK